MADFSLELNEDQLQIQKWVHDFAEDVVRPVAHEWDEREETPWPVIQEAANIGLYSWDFLNNCFADPTGLTMPLVSEVMFWGDAAIGLSIFGTAIGYFMFAIGIVTANIPLLFASRALDGLTGGNLAFANAAIGDISTNENRAKNFGALGAAFGIGFVVGPRAVEGTLRGPERVEEVEHALPMLAPGSLDRVERMQRASRYTDPSYIPEYLRTHPITVNRIAEAKNRAAQSKQQHAQSRASPKNN